MKKLTFIILVIALTACSKVNIEGSWVEDVPNMPGVKQGFTLKAGGEASSINMATLQYDSWKADGKQLVLWGKSIGNRQTISFSDTLQIVNLTNDSLILKKGENIYSYARTMNHQAENIIPASIITPAKKVKLVKGIMNIGHEVRSFRQWATLLLTGL